MAVNESNVSFLLVAWSSLVAVWICGGCCSLVRSGFFLLYILSSRLKVLNESPVAVSLLRKPVCLCFEDVSQNPFQHSKCPRPLQIGLISKSLLNKRKKEMLSVFKYLYT